MLKENQNQKPRQLPMFQDFDGHGGKGPVKRQITEKTEKKENKFEGDSQPETGKDELLEFERWSFDVPEGGAGRDGSANENTVLFQKGKGWSVIDSKGDEREASWSGVKLLLAKNYDHLLRTDEEFQKLARYFGQQ